MAAQVRQEQPRTPLKVVRANSMQIPSRLSPEQTAVQRITMKAEQLGQRGSQRSAGANARAVLHLNSLMAPQSPLRGLSYDAMVKHVAAVECTVPHLIRELHAKAASGESLAPVDVVRISRDNPLHKMFGTFGPSMTVETFLYLGDVQPSASVVSTTLSADGVSPEDYHDTMNGDKFISWIRNRLIPAFEKIFGKRKKMCLILDNAKYHHARGEDWLTPRTMKAPQLAEALRQIKVDSVTDGTHTWKSNTFSMLKRGKDGAVAMQSSRTARKYQETAEQTKTALSEVPASLCQSTIAHTEKLMSKWLSSPEAGSLHDWPSLDQLVIADHEERCDRMRPIAFNKHKRQ